MLTFVKQSVINHKTTDMEYSSKNIGAKVIWRFNQHQKGVSHQIEITGVITALVTSPKQDVTFYRADFGDLGSINIRPDGCGIRGFSDAEFVIQNN